MLKTKKNKIPVITGEPTGTSLKARRGVAVANGCPAKISDKMSCMGLWHGLCQMGNDAQISV